MIELHYVAAGLIVFATLFHSFLGEKELIAPTLAVDDDFIQQRMTQAIHRFAWHSASAFFLLTALIIVLPNSPSVLVWATGWLWLLLGLANLIMTKAKHPGGYLLSTIGLLILIGQAL